VKIKFFIKDLYKWNKIIVDKNFQICIIDFNKLNYNFIKEDFMLATIKLNDEEELDKLVNDLGIPFVELKYVEFDISFSFDIELNSKSIVIYYTRNYILVNMEDSCFSLTIEDKQIISDWISNYKNIDEILFKLWEKNENDKKHL